MVIFRTHRQHIPEVVRLGKHALKRPPKLLIGDKILISQTLADGDGEPPIRYVMEYFRTLPDLHGETERIWGEHWPYILEGTNCRALQTPFDIRKVKVSKRNYGPGGPIVHVHPADEYEIERLGLLK